MKLYQLTGADRSQGFSPYVWRIMMALAHKGLQADLVSLTFCEIAEKLGPLGCKTVPVLEVEGKHICDSWDIACYLEDTYPDRPSLFEGDTGKAHSLLINNISLYGLTMALFPAVAHDILSILDERDQAYFRSTREARLGRTLEEVAESQEKSLAAFRRLLAPYTLTLKAQDYFCGEAPAYTDYILYSIFQWAKGVSPLSLLEDDEPLALWRDRMDQLFDGLGNSLKQR